ncbi:MULTISPECIES: TnsD family Tn7-like transposition protein [Pseudomonas putida group]|uniref:TnsD family Tn7-like transposition protein n=1 Tax=Pseudomonas putida group TaxID=136845 RepID=UPI0009B85B76|nr:MULTISPECIES: TnsD family Tn7-like transposition protein [Pseudomonas putida group]MCL8300869.1 TnsD family transposase [Pseudomonas mosselii]MCL8341235.1 TnsD family transposase [Pseudomonas mosselii]
MELKFHFFPTAFPDETLHSVLSRYARLSGGSSRKAAFAGERAAASFTQNVAFPSRLGDLVGALPRGACFSVSQIISRHTLLPYFAPFLTSDQLRQAQESMAGDGKSLMLKLGINASRIEWAARVRFCSECVDEDIRRVGASYWHRVHQLPGVLVCPHHGTLLKVVEPGWSSRNSRQLNLPDDDCVQAHAIQLGAAEETLSTLRQIALSSQQLLNLEPCSLLAGVVRASLLQGAADLALTTGATNRLNLRRLGTHMATFFKSLPAAWEYSTLSECPAVLPSTWVTKLLRQPRGTHHPLKWIVLASALKVDLSCFPRVDKSSLPTRKRSSPFAPWSSETMGALPIIQGLSTVQAEVWKLALAGCEARQIADAVGVSLVYVYRTIRAISCGPDTWRKAKLLSQRRQRRESFEHEYQRFPAHRCLSYSWLYRCDRAWLLNCVAKYGSLHRSRPDSAGRFFTIDAELAEQVRCCAQQLRDLPGRPVWISRTRIGRELHVLARFEKQLSKLPLCQIALDQVCESTEQFRARRLLWAEAKLVGEQRCVTRTALHKTACIRPKI